MRLTLLLLLTALLACPVTFSLAGTSKKKPLIAVRFHAQAEENDTEVFASPLVIGDPPITIYIARIPIASEQDIESVYTFNAADGTMGAYFKLNSHGRFTLESVSAAKRGKIMVGLVNGKTATTQVIDKIISDGVVGIPNGLGIQDVELMEQEFNKKKKK